MGTANILFIADTGNNRIRKVTATNIISAGSVSTTSLNSPTDVWGDTAGNIYVTGYAACAMYMVSSAGVVNTIFAACGYSGDGSPGNSGVTNVRQPLALWGAADTNHLYFIDYGNKRVRYIPFTTNHIDLFAGTGNPGPFNTEVSPTLTNLNNTQGICGDSNGNIYITDATNQVIRRVDTSQSPATMVVIAGTQGVASANSTDNNGDGGDAKFATLNNPSFCYVNTAGVIYFVDAWSNKIRKVQTTVSPFPTFSPTKTPTIKPTIPTSFQDVNITSPNSGVGYVVHGGKTSSSQTVQVSGGSVKIGTKDIYLSANMTSETGFKIVGGAVQDHSGLVRSILTAAPSTKPTFKPTVRTARPSTVGPSLKPSVVRTTRPTVMPSMVDLHPSSLPTSRPSLPTAEPSEKPTSPTSLPSLTVRSSETLSPTLLSELRQPSSTPTTGQLNGDDNFHSDDVHFTLAPSAAPTVSPTLQPTSVRPSFFPSKHAASRPPVSRPTPFVTFAPSSVVNITQTPTSGPRLFIEVTQGGVYNRTLQDLEFVLNVTADVTVVGVGGADRFKIFPVDGVTLTVLHFDNQLDKIDLRAFESIRNISHVNITRGSVLINLPSNQTVRLMNLNPENITSDNFLFYEEVYVTQPTHRTWMAVYGSYVYASACLIAFCAGVYYCREDVSALLFASKRKLELNWDKYISHETAKRRAKISRVSYDRRVDGRVERDFDAHNPTHVTVIDLRDEQEGSFEYSIDSSNSSRSSRSSRSERSSDASERSSSDNRSSRKANSARSSLDREDTKESDDSVHTQSSEEDDETQSGSEVQQSRWNKMDLQQLLQLRPYSQKQCETRQHEAKESETCLLPPAFIDTPDILSEPDIESQRDSSPLPLSRNESMRSLNFDHTSNVYQQLKVDTTLNTDSEWDVEQGGRNMDSSLGVSASPAFVWSNYRGINWQANNSSSSSGEDDVEEGNRNKHHTTRDDIKVQSSSPKHNIHAQFNFISKSCNNTPNVTVKKTFTPPPRTSRQSASNDSLQSLFNDISSYSSSESERVHNIEKRRRTVEEVTGGIVDDESSRSDKKSAGNDLRKRSPRHDT
eukprot:gene25996-32516_t